MGSGVRFNNDGTYEFIEEEEKTLGDVADIGRSVHVGDKHSGGHRNDGGDVGDGAVDIIRRLVDKEAFMVTEFDKGNPVVKIKFYSDYDWMDFMNALGDARKLHDKVKIGEDK